MTRAPLNYSQEDIHALASQAELLVLTRGGSSSDLRRGSSRAVVTRHITQLRLPAAQIIMTLEQYWMHICYKEGNFYAFCPLVAFNF